MTKGLSTYGHGQLVVVYCFDSFWRCLDRRHQQKDLKLHHPTPNAYAVKKVYNWKSMVQYLLLLIQTHNEKITRPKVK